MITSPRKAKLAETPPIVGWVRTVMNGTPLSSRRARAADVLAICIREITPSCILAPPEAVMQMKGIPSSAALSAFRVTFSPATEPMLPPINLKSKQLMRTSLPSIFPLALTTASLSPVFFWASSIL